MKTTSAFKIVGSALLFALGALFLSGCVTSRIYKLPPISADEIEVKHTDWFGSIEASAKAPKVTEAYITWAEARWTLSYGGWQDTVRATNYRQRRHKDETTAAPSP